MAREKSTLDPNFAVTWAHLIGILGPHANGRREADDRAAVAGLGL